MGEIILNAVSCARGAFTLRVDALRIAPGEKIAILGENGCGKTTLLQALAGLLPISGSITRDGERWDRLSPRQRAAHMSYLPQEAGVLFNLTVDELLDLSLADQRPLRGEARQAVLAATETDGLRRRMYHSLSGGERRRAMLARILCRGGSMFFLDEPTAPLDLRHAEQVLRHVSGSPATVVAALHDINLALRHFERFLLMKNGRIAHDLRKADITTAALEEIYGIGLRFCGDHVVPDLERSGR